MSLLKLAYLELYRAILEQACIEFFFLKIRDLYKTNSTLWVHSTHLYHNESLVFVLNLKNTIMLR